MSIHDLHHRLDQGLALKHDWRRFYPACGTETTTPADFCAMGHKGVEAQRAARQQAMTSTERKAYRRGYLAAAKGVSRLRAVLAGAARSLRP